MGAGARPTRVDRHRTWRHLRRSGGAGGDYALGGLREGQEAFTGSSYHAREHTKTHKVIGPGGSGGGIANLHGKAQPGGNGWPRAKCLALVPQLYMTSLAYGRNILTGVTSPAGQWLVRNVVVWHRPNPMVGALGDKYRPSTSYITVATRSSKRWFDLTAVRGAPSPNTHARTAQGVEQRNTTGKAADRDGNFHTLNTLHATAGAPPLDAWFDDHNCWTLTTQPSSLAHYAMWPAKLAERLVLSMCPGEVCRTCGEPRRRVERTERHMPTRGNGSHEGSMLARMQGRPLATERSGLPSGATTTTGWTDCGHGDYRPGVVLDPFAGTGTTLAVADLHGRDAIGFDIDDRNRDLYDARRAEVARNLFGSRPELPGQLDMFSEPRA